MNKRLLLNGFLALVVVGIGVGSYFTVHSKSSSASTTQTFATAARGNVLESVTSTGNVQAPTDLSLSFQQSGQVTAIPVEVGTHVGAGQVLAKVDDTQQKIALKGAQAGLVSAQASYAALLRGETAIERESDAQSVVAAQQGITQAQQGLADAQQNAAANLVKYQQAITQAQQGVTSAQSAVTSAQSSVTQAEDALRSLQSGYDARRSSSESIDATLTRYQVDQAECPTPPGAAVVNGVTCSQIGNLTSFAKSVQSAQSGVTQAQSALTQAQAGVTSAQQGETSGELQDQQSIQNAQDQLTSAQNQYNSTVIGNEVKQEPPKPEQLAQAQASIVSAQGQLVTAEKNESDTTLRAPVSGVVAAVNGIVGQQSSGGSAASSSSSSSGSSGTGSSSSSSSGSSSGFIVLTNVNVLDVSVGFTETDAPNVHVGQAATITLDALPNQTFNGHVIELDTDSTLVSNVVTYNSLVSFDDPPSDVKPGMTASVNVVLAKRDNVITLPTSAVSTTDTSESVTVKPKSGAETTRTIAIGLRGDNAVEITSGLSVGDQVVITSTASTGTGTAGGFGGLGGGLGGLGGGGGGRVRTGG